MNLADKNKAIEKHVTDMVRNKSIRFYREPTFKFDE